MNLHSVLRAPNPASKVAHIRHAVGPAFLRANMYVFVDDAKCDLSKSIRGAGKSRNSGERAIRVESLLDD